MKVGIVNDQRLATEALRRVVQSDPKHEVIWTAENGCEALEKCQQQTPDVVLMDLVMPVMNGATATREIMRCAPCPVLVVTATVSGNYGLVCEALGHGAFDAVCTPTLGDRSPREAGAALLAKLDSVELIRKDARRESQAAAPRRCAPAEPTANSQRLPPLVAIGTSTGGPQALETVISSWPRDFPAAVVVVQHIGREFAASLTQWLGERTGLRVRAAAPGDRLESGTVFVAATDDHLLLRNDLRLTYCEQPLANPYRPSVDVFFQSLATYWPAPAIAAVLTGIGRDGAQGLLKLRQCGWHTVSQDERTSVVYGMPQAAAELGAARRILPLEEIGPHIASHVLRLAGT